MARNDWVVSYELSKARVSVAYRRDPGEEERVRKQGE
jgi:hypothetical protein